MARAPRKTARSPAQIAAGKKFAAGGRAAQAAHPRARSAAQKAATKKFAAAGRAAQNARRAGKAPAPKKKAALPVTTLIRPGTPQIWLPGCNDDLDTCGPVAVANHLLAATGIITPDREILALYEAAGGDGGASLADVLEAVSADGLAGAKLTCCERMEEAAPGLVCGVRMRRGYHAVLAHPYGMISWGLVMAFAGEPEEAWALEWEWDDGPGPQ